MSELTQSETSLLEDIRAQCDNLAAKLHDAVGVGLEITFNIDGISGKVTSFTVHRKTPIDLAALTRKKAN